MSSFLAFIYLMPIRVKALNIKYFRYSGKSKLVVGFCEYLSFTALNELYIFLFILRAVGRSENPGVLFSSIVVGIICPSWLI
jgi:hypothetical protein